MSEPPIPEEWFDPSSVQATDEVLGTFRSLALSLEPELRLKVRDRTFSDRFEVVDDKSIAVTGRTELEAWSNAVEAARARLSWRLRSLAAKVKREGRA